MEREETILKAFDPNDPPLYVNPLPLDPAKHGDLGLMDFGLTFAARGHAIPATAHEFPQLCAHYPIVFGADERALPIALTGLREGENLFMGQGGAWRDGAFVPAYLRRYPFIFAELGDQLILCVDVRDETVSAQGRHRFFDDGGKPADVLASAIEFCQSYHGAMEETKEFAAALRAAGVLADQELELGAGPDRQIKLSGFRLISEQKLAALADETFLEWRARGWLPFIYAHLVSVARFDLLSRLASKRIAGN